MVLSRGSAASGLAGWTRPIALEPIDRLSDRNGRRGTRTPHRRGPEHLIDAIIAAEDEDFNHPGVNPLARYARRGPMFRRAGTVRASTLTMQVVRRLSQNEEKTMSRKFEMAMAITLDGHHKEGVLQMYLDALHLGQAGNLSICGFEAAAKHYWGVRRA